MSVTSPRHGRVTATVNAEPTLVCVLACPLTLRHRLAIVTGVTLATASDPQSGKVVAPLDEAALDLRDGDVIDVSIVMPCLNEVGNIEHCVALASEGIARSGLRGEIVVADNGSTDGSDEVARAAGARVVYESKRGYGNAYLRGFAAARGRIIVMGDSDGTYDFSKLPELIAPLSQGYDYVLGSRFAGTILPGAMPWLHRYVGNPVLTRVLNVFFGLKSSDAHSGLRAFTRDSYERMDLNCEGMEFASEIVIKAARAKLKVAEVPIVYHPRGGESKLRTVRDGWRHLRFMLLVCPKYLFILPGLVLFTLGLVGQSVLLPGPLPTRFHDLDVHFSALFALLTVLGFGAIMFGLFAKVHATQRGFEERGRFLEWLVNDFTLERGLIAGGLVFLVGLVIDVVILAEWLGRDLGALNAIRPALFAMTLMMIGGHAMFTAFFLDLTRDAERRRVASLTAG